MVMACLAACWAAACCLVAFRRSARTVEARLAAFARHDEVAISLNLVLEMMVVAIRQGASIPHALDLVGSLVGGELGEGLRGAAKALAEGLDWRDAWLLAALGKDATGGSSSAGKARHSLRQPGDGMGDAGGSGTAKALAIFADALEESWTYGISPISRLESTIEQLDARQRALIERGASRLSVRLLLPTAMCFLPSFMLIGVVPSIGSFVS
ncbi:tadC protein [Bifidobacterium sp. ESL0763]|uniref:tadC protein n=1 Tax=Bifidobacterium sp. ESL0763 TaxID=2983227 RepID=UPI0023F636E2|nr:tadC protein [Bifidobacterium sp. ESL0763]MDF7664326.1 tadC protein [Bifidobacterium sp. ESL0763]